jgi:hypothetical protein
MSEQWRTVPGYEDYEVSDQGRVRSNKRRTPRIRPAVREGGYLQVGLWSASGRHYFTVHQLVMLAFVGPRPDELLTRHLDGEPSNNRLSNLAYGTPLENNLDTVRHGRFRNQNTARTHCTRGHGLSGDNLFTYRGRRQCVTCKNRRALEAWHRNKHKYA